MSKVIQKMPSFSSSFLLFSFLLVSFLHFQFDPPLLPPPPFFSWSSQALLLTHSFVYVLALSESALSCHFISMIFLTGSLERILRDFRSTPYPWVSFKPQEIQCCHYTSTIIADYHRKSAYFMPGTCLILYIKPKHYLVRFQVHRNIFH